MGSLGCLSCISPPFHHHHQPPPRHPHHHDHHPFPSPSATKLPQAAQRLCHHQTLPDDPLKEDKKVSRRLDRRRVLLGSATLAGFLVQNYGNVALADVKIALSNVNATEVPCPEGQTTVTGGTSFGASCFLVTGDAVNPVKQTVYNADVFGRVYDAQGEPALDAVENLRIDTIPEIPPGKSKVTFQITVNSAQAKLGPLELKNFKATGFLGRVNNRQGTGRLDDIDFSELDDSEIP